MTNWGSRLGISRIVESIFMNMRDANDQGGSLSVKERLGASIIGGGVACWNQPIEVIRVKVFYDRDDIYREIRCNPKLRIPLVL